MSKLPALPSEDDKLNPADKVTALLLTMTKPSADSIIKKFDNREIRLVAHAASALPAISDETIERLVDELYAALDTAGALAGSSNGAQQLLSGVVSDEQIAEILAELAGNASERVWGKLDQAKDERIAEFIASEQPQVAAVILSRLDPGKAAAVMEKLSGEQRADLSRRLLVLKPPSDTALRIVAERLREELFGEVVVEEGGGEVDKHAHLASILNKLERDQIEEILSTIEASDPSDAARVKSFVFTFEDIAGMEAEDRARLMDEVPADRVVMALRDADQALSDLILQVLSPRSRRIVEAELATETRVPAKAIGEARRWIAVLALSMADRALIKLRPAPAAAAPEA